MGQFVSGRTCGREEYLEHRRLEELRAPKVHLRPTDESSAGLSQETRRAATSGLPIHSPADEHYKTQP